MPSQFRYVTPVAPEVATGPVAAVYAQLAGDFGLPRMPVFMTLSPAPDVLAATWSVLRESLLAGSAPRTGKEVVALAVSLANRCPFCVAAHTTLLHATGDHRLGETLASGRTPEDPGHAALLAWATATGTPGAPELAAPPFPREQAAAYVGTALAFHFINRTASALLTDNLLPADLQRSRLVRSLGGRMMSRTVRRRLTPGLSLPLLPVGTTADPPPAWADGAPVGAAFAALRSAASAGGDLLSDRARAVVARTVAAWDGEHPPVTGGPLPEALNSLPDADRPAARLVLLAALAPYRVTDLDVAAWRTTGPAGPEREGALVRLVAFGALLATERVEALVAGGPQEPVLW